MGLRVALRKESVDRNYQIKICAAITTVALRKESVDRNSDNTRAIVRATVALRKESVDRNFLFGVDAAPARRVALRKESVDRNPGFAKFAYGRIKSLSARRAWIEIQCVWMPLALPVCRSPQGERG